jgi:hypothetical protein
MTVPAVTPEPVSVMPTEIAPAESAVTVRTFAAIEPVTVAPTMPPGPMVYASCAGVTS